MINKTIEIKNPITGVRIYIAEYDFNNEYSQHGALIVCGNLGHGWRLPTKSELELMYSELHKKGEGNFKNSYYWSTNGEVNFGTWFSDINQKLKIFANMYHGTTFKEHIGQRVRAVRDFI
jgi:hypothetical protein